MKSNVILKFIIIIIIIIIDNQQSSVETTTLIKRYRIIRPKRLLQRKQRQTILFTTTEGHSLQVPRNDNNNNGDNIMQPMLPQISPTTSNQMQQEKPQQQFQQQPQQSEQQLQPKSDRKMSWASWSAPSINSNYINVIDTGNTRQESWNQPITSFRSSNDNGDEQPPGAYHWGYRWMDEFGNQMFREESADGYGTVRGQYSYREATGIIRIVEYIADQNGYRTRIRSNEPGIITSNPANAEIIRFENENDIPAK